MPGEEVTPAVADLGIDEREVMREAGWAKMAVIEECGGARCGDRAGRKAGGILNGAPPSSNMGHT